MSNLKISSGSALCRLARPPTESICSRLWNPRADGCRAWSFCTFFVSVAAPLADTHIFKALARLIITIKTKVVSPICKFTIIIYRRFASISSSSLGWSPANHNVLCRITHNLKFKQAPAFSLWPASPAFPLDTIEQCAPFITFWTKTYNRQRNLEQLFYDTAYNMFWPSVIVEIKVNY